MIRNCYLKIVAILLFAQIAACSAETPTAATSSACPQAEPMLHLIGSKILFNGTPEEFLQRAQSTLQVESDNTFSPIPVLTRRNIHFKKQEAWLQEAEVRYDIEEGKAVFDGAVFEIPPGCYSSPEQFLKASAEAIGPDFKDGSAGDPTVINRTWYWPDPDENYIRYISLFAGNDLYHIKVERDPAPQEGD